MRIALIGAGGFAKEVYEIAVLCGHEVIGTFSENSGRIYDLPDLGGLGDLSNKTYLFDGLAIAIGLNSIQMLEKRALILKNLLSQNFNLVNLISPYSRVHQSLVLGSGVYIHHDVVISCDVCIGNGVIVNTSAKIGHDSTIGDNVSVGSGVFIGGNTHISSNVLIGAMSAIKDNVSLGSNVVVGMGSIVMKSINERRIIMPCITKPIPLDSI